MTQVREIMEIDVPRAYPEDDLDKIYTKMIENRLLHVPIIDHQDRLIGLVSHPDIVQAAFFGQGKTRVADKHEILRTLVAKDVMNDDPVTVKPEEAVSRAGGLMMTSRTGCLPVVEENSHLVGLLTDMDFVKYVAAQD